MTTLKVPDMHCANCVARISRALEAAGLQFEVSLEEKTVSIGGGADALARAKSELDDLGFTAD